MSNKETLYLDNTRPVNTPTENKVIYDRLLTP